jgi:hypothetical protein
MSYVAKNRFLSLKDYLRFNVCVSTYRIIKFHMGNGVLSLKVLDDTDINACHSLYLCAH